MLENGVITVGEQDKKTPAAITHTSDAESLFHERTTQWSLYRLDSHLNECIRRQLHQHTRRNHGGGDSYDAPAPSKPLAEDMAWIAPPPQLKDETTADSQCRGVSQW